MRQPTSALRRRHLAVAAASLLGSVLPAAAQAPAGVPQVGAGRIERLADFPSRHGRALSAGIAPVASPRSTRRPGVPIGS